MAEPRPGRPTPDSPRAPPAFLRPPSFPPPPSLLATLVYPPPDVKASPGCPTCRSLRQRRSSRISREQCVTGAAAPFTSRRELEALLLDEPGADRATSASPAFCRWPAGR